MSALIVNSLLSVIAAATPLLLAATGELVTERSGVLNLGVEGMMLVGAIAGFAVAHSTGIATLGVFASIVAGALTSLAFGFLTLTMLANQIATGLALTIFGRGFSALIGAGFVGIAAPTLPKLHVPLLTDIPFIGPVLFGQDPLIYVSFIALAGVAWFLYRTHAGLILRSVGDSHNAAHAIGYPVIRIRYAATAFGGAMAGLAGGYMSLSYSPHVGRGHDGWPRLDCAGAGGVCRLAAVPLACGRISVRRHHVFVAVCAGRGHPDPVAAGFVLCPISERSWCW